MVTGQINDPDPPPIGLTGTVVAQANAGTPLEQLHVDWDQVPGRRARSLMLIPEDYSKIVRIGGEAGE